MAAQRVRRANWRGPNREVDGIVRWGLIDLKRVSPTHSASSFMAARSTLWDISGRE
jgi:hypothetical protein